MSDEPPKTLFALIKVKRQTTLELLWIGFFIGGILAIILGIAAIKVGLCKYQDARVSVESCLLNEKIKG